MTEHIFTGHHNGSTFPFLVATNPHQYWHLANDLLEHSFPDAPIVQSSSYFYVTDELVRGGKEWPKKWLRVGTHDGFGAALFADLSVPEGDDWCWVALAADPLPQPPIVYFDQDGDVVFPPRAVMPTEQLRAVVLEWAETGERPRSVEWLPINALVWRLDKDGGVVVRWAGLSA